METIDFPELTEVTGKLTDRRKQLADIFLEARDGAAEGPVDLKRIKSLTGTSAEKAEQVKKLHEEINGLAKDREDLVATHKAAAAVAGWVDDDLTIGELGMPGGRKRRTIGDAFGEAGIIKKSRGKLEAQVADFDVKTLFQTTDGWAPESVRGPRMVDYVQAPIALLSLIPTTTTGQSTVKYMEETTYTNAAAETAEGGSKPEAALKVEEKSSDVRKIPVWLHVTDEQLEDEPRAREYINNRLPLMVRQRLAGQIIVGDGSAPNLRGVLNVVGIQTQAKGSDPAPDAIYKAMVKVIVTGEAMPDAYVTNPVDWQDIRLLRTADGIYIFGNPSDPGPDRIWGLRVVQEQRVTENTGIVGDFGNFSELAVRKGIELTTGWVNDDFIKNQQVVLAEMRAAFIVYRPKAFCTVTGI